MRKNACFLGGLAFAILFAGGIAGARSHAVPDRLDRWFEQIDLDASGTLTMDEMRDAAAARFAALDLDGDGTVHRAERMAGRDARLKARFERADRNRDGRLDATEMEEVAKQRARQRLARLDSDGDGMLSLGELQRGRTALAAATAFDGARLTLPQLHARMTATFRRADADGDGVVTLREAVRDATGEAEP